MAVASDRGTKTTTGTWSNMKDSAKKGLNTGKAAVDTASSKVTTTANKVLGNGTVPLSNKALDTNMIPGGTLSAADDPLKNQKLVPGTYMSGGGGGRSVTYVGNDGSKNTGTVKVTPGKTPDYYAELGRLYETMYNDQVAANDAALEAARARAQETTDAQIAALADQYAGTNRALYRDYMNSRRTLPQQLAAMGYNGGLSESSLLRLNNSYEEGLNENERARLAQETSYNQALAQQLFEAQQKATEANNQARQNWYGQQATLKDMIYKDQQQRAATMAASGDFTEYERLGFSPSEIKYLKQMWKKMNPNIK